MIKNKPVRVCDDCEERLGKWKCGVCGKDLCNECGEYNTDGLFGATLDTNNGEFILYRNKEGDDGILLCKKCEKIVIPTTNTLKFWKEVIRDSKIKEVIINKIRDRIILKNLKGDKEKDEE